MRFGKSENGCSLVKPHEFELHSLDAMGEAVASDVVKEQGALDQSSRQAYEQAIAFLKKSLLEQDTVISNLHNTNKQLREKLEEYDDADFDYLRKIDECKAIVEKSIEEKVNLIRQKYAESFQDKLISESGKLKALNNKLLFRIKDLKKVRVQNDILQSKIKDLKNSHALKIHQLTRVHNANVLQLKESITRLNKRVGEANKKIISLEVGKVTQDKVNQEIENKFQENIAKLAAKRKQCKVLSKSNEKLNSDVNSLQGKLNQLAQKQACLNKESKSENFPLHNQSLNLKSSSMFFCQVLDGQENNNFGFPILPSLESMQDDEAIDLTNQHMVIKGWSEKKEIIR